MERTPWSQTNRPGEVPGKCVLCEGRARTWVLTLNSPGIRFLLTGFCEEHGAWEGGVGVRLRAPEELEVLEVMES